MTSVIRVFYFCLPFPAAWQRRLSLLPLLLWLGLSTAAAQVPAEVASALAKARVPLSSVSLLVTDVTPGGPTRLSQRADVAVNPASVMKLVTTFAALEQLGPSFTWRTPVFIDGAVQGGVLQGNVYIAGQGDPKLVAERLWLLLKRVQGLGIQTIAGDIVLDHSAFETISQDPGSFDGEPLRPYNASPDALLVNFKSVVITLVPDAKANVARLSYDLPLAGVQMPTTVALSKEPCGDWRGALKADFSDPTQLRFSGSYPAACGERVWPVAYADPASHAARAVAGLWASMGGALRGQARDGRVPAGLAPVFEMSSPTLTEVVRDVNKYSNNVMAQQLFLTLSQQTTGRGSRAASRDLLARWWQSRMGGTDAPVLDNGSGLSREERITPLALARLLQTAWASPLMPELMSSLPITGVDGTLRRSRATAGAAHLKTGTLNGVSAVAGYVHGVSGKRYVLVAVVNHPGAVAARPAFDALVDWVANDKP